MKEIRIGVKNSQGKLQGGSDIRQSFKKLVLFIKDLGQGGDERQQSCFWLAFWGGGWLPEFGAALLS